MLYHVARSANRQEKDTKIQQKTTTHRETPRLFFPQNHRTQSKTNLITICRLSTPQAAKTHGRGELGYQPVRSGWGGGAGESIVEYRRIWGVGAS